MNELSLGYYAAICKGNAELLETFKTHLLTDFREMDSKFFSAVAANDFGSMRKELHKMYPIAVNLNFRRMLDLIEHYRSDQPEEWGKLHPGLRTCFSEVYDLLKAS